MSFKLTHRSATLLVGEDTITATAPATAIGFADLVVGTALAENHWKTATHDAIQELEREQP